MVKTIYPKQSLTVETSNWTLNFMDSASTDSETLISQMKYEVDFYLSFSW